MYFISNIVFFAWHCEYFQAGSVVINLALFDFLEKDLEGKFWNDKFEKAVACTLHTQWKTNSGKKCNVCNKLVNLFQ